MRAAWIAMVIGVSNFALAAPALADTSVWGQSTGTFNWSDAANWVSSDIANGTDEDARFDTPTGTRNIDLNGQFTVAGVEFSNTSVVNFTNSIRNFNVGGDSLTFDAPDAGPAFIISSGIGTNQNRLQSDMVFADDVVATVSNTAGNSTAGALSLTGNVTGPGGLTKTGAGTMTVAYNASDTGQIKAWQGPTIVNGGRWRTSLGGTNGMLTSSFTINANAHLEQISDGTYTFGPGTMFLNGTGIAGAGAIRPNRDAGVGRKLAIANPIELLSTSSIHSQTQTSATPDDGSAGYIKLTGVISGVGALQLTAPSHDDKLGTYFLTNTNTYTGGTELYGGRLVVGRDETGTLFPAATLGTGNVTVFNGTLSNSEARSRLTIPNLNSGGIENVISDIATVTLQGGFTGSLAQAGYAELLSGVEETIGSLVLGSTTYTAPGTYGSATSGADFQFADYFAGDGVFRIAGSVVTGDHNGDGLIDAADYVVWRKNPEGNGGDPGGYDAWQENFGETVPGGGGAGGVPEPGALVLIAVAATGALATRRTLRRRL